MAAFVRRRHTGVILSLIQLLLTSLAFAQTPSATSSAQVSPPAGTIAGLRDTSSVPLRILCIGDSITVGLGDGNALGLNNGYRLDLYNLLTAAGIPTSFIGTQVSGTDNPQPRMEGYGWQTIYSILNHIQLNGILGEQPNLILIHAGTNDNDLPQEPDDAAVMYANAPARLGNLLDYVLDQAPEAVVLVAKLIQNKYNQTQTDWFNAQVPTIVSARYANAHKVQMVDMSMIGGNELLDALHPVAAGYSDMASRWFDAIMGVQESWWSMPSPISLPVASPASSVTASQTPPVSSGGAFVTGTPMSTDLRTGLVVSSTAHLSPSQTALGNALQTAAANHASQSVDPQGRPWIAGLMCMAILLVHSRFMIS